jgi:lipopolysaccharide/colanic/teichoic acid biosynthesis glycosyltransferase
MSLVGPRPEMVFIVDRYNELEKKRLLVKPGLTGLWQIMGRKDKPIHEDLWLDLFYIKKQSISWDIFILFETIPSLLFSRIIW